MDRGKWVCPHDPTGIDPDTAAYCPQKVWKRTEADTTYVPSHTAASEGSEK